MNVFKLLSIVSLSLFLGACGSNSNQKQPNFSIATNAKKDRIAIDQILTLDILNPKKHQIDSVVYSYEGRLINDKIDLKDFKLGKQTIEAVVYFNGNTETISKSLTILNDQPPKVYTYKIINEYPHDITSYTQGLEFYEGNLYESTGQNGESKLLKVDYKTGEHLKRLDLDRAYFGEGLTILNNNIYQLTWQKGVGFVYDVDSFERTSTFEYGNSKQGWGICNDGNVLYKSDGTEKIWILDPETLVEKDFIQTYTNKSKIVEINELEWVNGKIYANRYQKNGVAIINPKNGAIEGVIDFSPLKDRVTQHPKLDVLNGIAYNPETKTLFVTGKRWDKLFEVEIIEK